MILDEVEKQYARYLECMERQGLQQWRPLLDEIHKLKKTLLKLETDETDPMEYLAEHNQRIQDSILSVPVHQSAVPIHQLLRVPLEKMEIPLDILNILTSAGFDVNFSKDGVTSLHIAINYNHYKAVRWLVEHGADCNIAMYHRASPIVLLSRQPSVPLDLFDLLNTPETLNAGYYLPLHEALKYRHTDYALHLIQLGAKLDVNDTHFKIPLDYFVNTY